MATPGRAGGGDGGGGGGDDGAATWSSQLQVFEQDFDTAMEIWMYQDPAVERLYCDEKRARRRKSTSSQDSAYLSQSQSQRPARKRRRRTIGADEARADVPAPPLSLSYITQPGQAIEASVSQSVETAKPAQAEAVKLAVVTVREDSAGPTVFDDRSRSVEVKEPCDERVPEAIGEEDKATDAARDNVETAHPQSKIDSPAPDRSSITSSGGSHAPIEFSGSLLQARHSPSACRRDQAPPDTTVVGLFQTGSGKNVRVSKARMHDYEEKLRQEECTANVRGDDSAPSSANGTTVAGSFQTGLGKNVRISASRLSDYEEKLLGDDGSDMGRASEPTRQASLSPGTTIVSLFQTGSGKSVRVSKDRLQVYRDKLSEDMPETHPDETAASETTVQSLFQTGSGRNVRISKTRLRDYEQKLGEEESEPVNPGRAAIDSSSDMTVAGLFQTGSGKSAHVSKARLQDYEVKLRECDDGKESVDRESAANGTSSRPWGVNRPLAAPTVLPSSKSTVPSLFHTGTGRDVCVSESRLRDYEEKLQNDECFAEATSASNGQSGVDGTHETNADGMGAATAELPSSMMEPTVAGLFQTGSGKTMRISKARLSEYEAKLKKDDDTNDPAPAQELSAAAVEGLFQTGLGKRVRVSKARLHDYEQKLRDEEDAVQESRSNMNDNDRSPAGGRRRIDAAGPVPVSASDKTIVGLFQTGLGKSVHVSKERLQDYEEKLRQEEHTSEAHRGDSTVQDTAVVSLFQTGSGKDVRVSKERLRAYEDKLLEEESADVTPQETAELQAQSETTVASLFQTGSGNSVTVSKERLREFEVKLREEEEAERVGTGQADRSNDTNAAVASEFDDRDMQSCHASEAFGAADRGEEVDTAKTPTLGRQTVGKRPPFAQRPSLLSVRIPANTKPPSDAGRESQWKQRPPRPLPRAPLPEIDLQFDMENQVADNDPAHDSGDTEPKFAVLNNRANASCDLHKTSPSPQKQSGARIKPRPQLRMLRRPQIGSGSGATPSRRQAGDKRKFHPPLLKSTGLAANQPVATPPISSHSSPTTRHKRPKLDSPRQPAANAFRFREVMKVPFALLQDMQTANGSSGDTHYVDGDRGLSSVTAATARFVVFPRDESASSAVAFHARSSFEEPYDANELMGLREMYNHMTNARLLESPGGTARTGSGATFEWFANHYRWIVWKLASMERAFPRFLLGKYLTKDQVMYQISRRYQRDVVAAERSVLKKMLNRDSSSLSCMVLCIASVLPFPKRSDESLGLPEHWQLALVLTDGWYAVYAVPDAPLAAALWRAHMKSSIVGTKIAVWNSALRNSIEGIDPLECAIARGDCNSSSPWKNPLLATDSEELTQWPYLELHYNSTRRVQFGERLGAERLRVVSSVGSGINNRQQRRLDFSLLKSVPLRSLVIGGGMVRSVRVVVRRISPVLHLQGKDWAVGPRILCADQMHTYFEMRSRLQQQLDGGADTSDYDGRSASDAQMPIPFIKLEVECGHIRREESAAADFALLTVWRPGDEMLSGAVREGDEYFVSSLSVGWKIDGDRSRGGGAFLRLSSTKGTTFEKIERQFTSDEHSSYSVCVNIQEATDQYRQDEASGTICRERRPVIDVCVYVVSVAAKEECAPSRPRAPPTGNKPASAPSEASSSHANDFTAKSFVQHAFVTDGSHGLMCVRIPSTDVAIVHDHNRSGGNDRRRSFGSSSSSAMFTFRRGGTNTWREGAVVCLRALEISHYDERLGLLDCLVAEGTQIVTFPSTKSHFSGEFTELQRAAKEESGKFLAGASKLKRYVDRRILGMDVAPSQDSVARHDEEADRLTQDLMSQHESLFEAKSPANAPLTVTAEQPNMATATETSEVWEARIARALPVPVGSSHACDADMAALLVVSQAGSDSSSHANGSAFRSVYVSAQQLCKLRELLANGASGASEPTVGKSNASESRSSRELTQDVARIIRQQEAGAMGQPGIVEIRFEVRRVTSERLLNSWKPWERENAVVWVVTSLQSANCAVTTPADPSTCRC